LRLGFVVFAVAMVTYAIGLFSVIGSEVLKDVGTAGVAIDLGGTFLFAAAGGHGHHATQDGLLKCVVVRSSLAG
jgi:hypothetical protein